MLEVVKREVTSKRSSHLASQPAKAPGACTSTPRKEEVDAADITSIDVNAAYRAMEKELLARAAATDGPINMSAAELEVIMRWVLQYALSLPKDLPLFRPDVFTQSIFGELSAADTFLRRNRVLKRRRFRIGGDVHEAGYINYLGVGIIATHFGLERFLPSMVLGHNLGQMGGLFGGDGNRNRYDIGPGTYWAS